MINSAMETAAPKAPRGFFYMGRWRGGDLVAKRATSLMVHVAGHGARRVYRSDHSGRYYIVLGLRRVVVDPVKIAALCRR